MKFSSLTGAATVEPAAGVVLERGEVAPGSPASDMEIGECGGPQLHSSAPAKPSSKCLMRRRGCARISVIARMIPSAAANHMLERGVVAHSVGNVRFSTQSCPPATHCGHQPFQRSPSDIVENHLLSAGNLEHPVGNLGHSWKCARVWRPPQVGPSYGSENPQGFWTTRGLILLRWSARDFYASPRQRPIAGPVRSLAPC